jgi:hypothetical protein
MASILEAGSYRGAAIDFASLVDTIAQKNPSLEIFWIDSPQEGKYFFINEIPIVKEVANPVWHI